MTPNKYQGLTERSTPAYPARLVTGILIASVTYLSILSFLNARGIYASAAIAGGTEGLIYAACLYVVRRHLPLSTITFSFCAFAWLIFAWLIRQSPDVKSLRDLLIPILFLSLGRYVADIQFADRSVKLISYILIAAGLFEVFFTDTYANLFNTFSFYVHIGGISQSSAAFEGQMLTLNGYRPEGIGRTILPQIFGPHRASSLLMEPVAVGNFSVILMAWALSKPWAEMRKMPVFIICAAVLITLSDSRFGMMMSAALLLLRLFPVRMVSRIAPTIPFLLLAVVLGIAANLYSKEDNLIGRIYRSGVEVLNFDWTLLMGLSNPLPNYGDMGYAYMISRFGAPLSILLITLVFLIPMSDQRGIRFRALITLYIFANLGISGTSIFALKTAGVVWFLMGVLTDRAQIPGQTPKSQPDQVLASQQTHLVSAATTTAHPSATKGKTA
ncbi:putative polymerase [Rhodoferax sp. OV413]|uniref:polysaccharide polymerase n=1 Tax=Rhodoferax sp. OV413 TaxID=1855285 RepID=UPI0008869BB2|nr:polysaccharide polymerase [Rhodoferax sp. OV413]SDP79237.1 putative polymerase [Rhodoferax sp. OV413]